MISDDVKNDQAIVVKMAIICDNKNKYLSVLVFIDRYNHELIDIVIGISEDSRFFNVIKVNKHWTEIEKSIMINNQSNISDSVIMDLLDTGLRALLKNPSNIDLIILSEMYNNVRTVIGVFEKTIQEIINDNPTIFDVAFQNALISDIDRQRELIRSDIENGNYDNYYETEEEMEYEKKNEEKPSYVIINSSFVVSPISGKSLSTVSVGDKIMARISRDTRDEQRVLMELRGKKTKDGKYVVPAEVVQKSFNKNGVFKILLKFISGVYSIVEENDPIKVKMYNPDEFNDTIPVKPEKKFGMPGWLVNILIFFSIWTIALVIVALYLFR